jgi:cobalt-zinc-cadmium efflux system protein
MVKQEDQELLARMNKLTKETALAAKREAKASKHELADYRKRKADEKKAAKKKMKKDMEEARIRLEQVKKDIKANASAVYGREKRGLKRFLKRQNISEATFFGLIVNLFFSFFEFVGGIISGSAAIMSDAIHDLGDALSLGFSIYFGRKAKHGPDKKYTYGYSRFSVLGVFVTTVILAIGASFMIFISILRILEPSEVNLPIMIILSVVGLVVNTLAAFRTENGRFNVLKAIEQRSVNGIILEDVAGWFVVLVGTIVMMCTDWVWLDPVMSIVISVYLIGTSFNSFRKILDLFLEKVPEGGSVDVVRYQVLAIPHVKDVHHIHLWSMDGEKLCATMHVVVDGKIVDGILIENSVDNPMNIKKEIRKQLRTTGIKEVTLELETEGEKCKK